MQWLTLRLALVQGAAFYGVTIVMALWFAGWNVAEVPAWLYLYAFLPLVFCWLGNRVLAQNPQGWRHTVALGLSWGLPAAALVSSQELLRGGLRTLSAWLIFLVVWLLASVVYGAVMEGLGKAFAAKTD